MKEEIKMLKAEAEKLSLKAYQLEKLLEQFPDLELGRNRWNREFFHSEMVNELAVDCEFIHSCGCCSDSPLYVQPYILVDGFGRVYTKPFQIYIGERDEYGSSGDRQDRDCEETLKKYKLRQEIIDKVNSHFNRNEDNNVSY